MVLESLIGVRGAEDKPLRVFFLGILYAGVAIFLALLVFRSESSMVMVALTVFASIPLMYNTIKFEEAKDIEIEDENKLLKQHSKALTFFTLLFLGFTVAFTLAFIFLPDSSASELFNSQLSTIERINSKVTGEFLSSNFFVVVLVNNFRVMLFAFLFSFFYGAGAIFILTWNASVIATAIGTFFRNNISSVAQQVGYDKIAAYFGIFSIALFRYLTHGIFEILAYFIAGLAGGLISIAVIRHSFQSKNFRKVLFDAVDLMFLAILILIFAAFIEAFVTPRVFS